MRASRTPPARSLDMSGRVAPVTGSSRGPGRAEALALARRGARIVLAGVTDAAEVAEAIAGAGGQAVQVTADLARPEAAGEVFAEAPAAFGDVHVLVSNAGVVRDKMRLSLSGEDWAHVLAVSLPAPFYLAGAAARHWRDLRRAGSLEPRVIVSTASESGLYGNAGQANYAAAKAGVTALTLTLAAELRRYGIRVSAIAPRARTPMSRHAFGDLPRSAAFDPFAAEHVARVTAWLAAGAADAVTGQVLVVHGAAVQVMRPWPAGQRAAGHGSWDDAALLALGGTLFPDGPPSPPPAVRELSASTLDDTEVTT
jgi:NAD(P)-dependent dehydrogenase (short-subunit alcohol dehydrogenase family)